MSNIDRIANELERSYRQGIETAAGFIEARGDSESIEMARMIREVFLAPRVRVKPSPPDYEYEDRFEDKIEDKEPPE